MSIIEIESEPVVVDGPADPSVGLADGPSLDLTDQAQSSRVRPTFTITDAAVACAVSRKTITRKLADLAEHGAAKDDDGIWRIPVEALLAVGLHPGRSLPSQQPAQRPTVAAPAPSPAPVERAAEADLVTVPRQRWDDLRIRLARAEAEASERALALADARLALRALTAGPAPSAVGPVSAGHATDSTSAPGSRPVDPSTPASDAAVPAAAPTPEGDAAVVAGPPPNPGPLAATSQVSVGDPAAQLAAARTHAAQNGGYVPAAPAAPVRKRRWWQSK